MALYAPVASRQEIDGNGRPYAGGLVYTFQSGTTIPKTTYDKDGNANSNPIVLDSEGRYTIRLDTGAYSMTMTDGVGATYFNPAVIEGVVVWSSDDIGYADAFGVFTTVNTMTDLRALTQASAAFVLVRGYNVAGDNGGGIFFWDSANTSDDDTGVIIKANGYSGAGRWHRQFTGNVNVRWFGAKAGGLDDSTYFANAIAYATYYQTGIELDNGTFTLASDPGFTVSLPVTMGDAILKWSGFAPTLNVQIPISDVNQHFMYGSGDDPVFASNTGGAYAEIKNIWLDGSTPGWYQSSLKNDYDSQFTTVNSSISTIQGDITTLQGDVTTLQGDVVSINADIASMNNFLLSGTLNGLTLSKYSTYTIQMGPGGATTTNGVAYYPTSVSTYRLKQLDVVWAPGSNVGGRASAVALTNNTWYMVFLLGKTTDPTAYEMGFDTSASAFNLLSDASASGFDTYRRIGMILNHNSAIQPFVQKGDNFYWQIPTAESQITTTSDTNHHTVYPVYAPNISTSIRFNVYRTSGSSSSFPNFFDGDIWTNGLPSIAFAQASYGPSFIDGEATNVDGLVTTSSGGIIYALTYSNIIYFVITITGWVDTRGKS